MAFAHPTIISILNKIKPPYNISGATQIQVKLALENLEFVNKSISEVKIEKNRLISILNTISQVEKVYPSHANFILVKLNNSQALFDYLIDHKIITRNRSNVTMCESSIRITIGTKDENNVLLDNIMSFYK